MVKLHRRTVLRWTAASALFVPGGVMAAAPAAPPLNEQGFVRIGGIDQWIAIQGPGGASPVILYLHGGPAEAQSPFLKEFGALGTRLTS